MTISKDEAGSIPGPILKDEAAEALASIADTQSRLYDLHMADQVMPGLLGTGIIGLIGFGLQSKLFEQAYGMKLLTGYIGAMALIGIVLLIALFFHLFFKLIALRVFRPIRLKFEYNFRHFMAAMPLCQILIFTITLPPSLKDPAASNASLMFSFSISYALAAMLWLGRWHAYGAVVIILSIAMICVLEHQIDARFTWLALLCGLGLLPAGLWMLIERRRSDHA